MTNNFNFISKFYDFLGFLIFRKVLKKSQLFFMDKIPPQSRILIVGGGTGWFLEKLLKNSSPSRVVYVEASSEMIKLSRDKISKIHHETELELINAPIEKILLPGKFDVIITNYFLDLFREEQLKGIGEQLYPLLDNKGIWIFTDFKINQKGFIHRAWQRALLKAMYLFFRYISKVNADRLPDFTAFFKELKLKKVYSKVFFSGMMVTELYSKDELSDGEG